MVYCGECGEQNLDERKYCWKCGKPLYLGTGVQSGERKQSTEEPPGVLEDDIEREVANLRASRNKNINSALDVETSAERAVARTKNYIGASIIVLVLYGLFWLPGLIVNILYYKDAKRMEKTAEKSLPGVGCLSFMLNLHLVALLIAVPIVVIAILALLAPQISNIFSRVGAESAIATPTPTFIPSTDFVEPKPFRTTPTQTPTTVRRNPPTPTLVATSITSGLMKGGIRIENWEWLALGYTLVDYARQVEVQMLFHNSGVSDWVSLDFRLVAEGTETIPLSVVIADYDIPNKTYSSARDLDWWGGEQFGSNQYLFVIATFSTPQGCLSADEQKDACMRAKDIRIKWMQYNLVERIGLFSN